MLGRLAMVYGHSSGLLPWEASIMIAGKCQLFFLFLLLATTTEMQTTEEWL